jgi:predicted acyltransferase
VTTLASTAPAPSIAGRLVSLDAFRGLAVAGMVLANNAGSWEHVWWPLEHAPWHGCTPTDLVFPAFLFIVGTAMAFSLDRHTLDRKPGAAVYLRILRRAAILFGLGLLLNGFPLYDFSTLRVLGVLQRIALAYLLAALAVLHLDRRVLAGLSAAVLLGYWGAMTLIPVPGHGAGVLTEAGNLVGYLDRLLIGTPHLYLQKGFDPEGLLSTLPATVTVFAGYFAGLWLREHPTERSTAVGLAGAGLICVLAGALWGLLFPINKQLWTSSYVVFTAGWALLLLAASYWAIEVRGWRRAGWPFEVFGLNAIVLFVGSGLLGRILRRTRIGEAPDAPNAVTWLYGNLFEPWAGAYGGSFAYALATLVLWWLVCYLLYRRRWFLKI